MPRLKLPYILPFVAGLTMIGVLAFAPDLLAQSDSLAEVGEATGLGTEDPRIIVARLIRTFLTVLGVLAVLIVLYGGFVWMTAGGNEEKVEKAKKILTRGAIGLAIILMSWSITSFVIAALLGASGTSDGGSGSGGSGGGGLGGGSSSSFYITDFSPDSDVSIRNIVLTTTFNKTIDVDSVASGVTVTNTASGETVAGTVSVSGNRMTFTPTAACPSPNEDRFCFDSDTAFSVSVQSSLKSSSGLSLSCTSTSCSSSFTSGSLVDTEDPIARITDPASGDGVEAGSAEIVQTHATDDSEVSSAIFAVDEVTFDTVGALGNDLSDVTIESTWDTTALTVGESYRVSVEVSDIAGNTDGYSVLVTARGAWCFNEELDADYGETDVDCGGDSSSVNYCGACDGSSCTEDADCSSGSCVEGICTSLPEIAGFSPANGAVGTFVTIDGSGFGTNGTVTFAGADGASIEADIPSCSDGWSDTQIVVEVPVGAVDGPITVTTTDDLSDSSDDDEGALFDDYDVNETVRPKLCSLSPDNGESTAGTTLSGFDFGDSQGSSTVLFGTTTAGSYVSWEDVAVDVTVPSLEDGDYDVTVVVDGISSNSVAFEVEEDTTGDPVISNIDPSSAAIGDYITLAGSNFGSLEGSVRFVDSSGNEALASVDFPSACEEDYWSPTEVTVIVPDELQNGSSLVPGDYTIYLITQEGAQSEAVDFTVSDGDPNPGICSISPEYGLAGTEVTIYGERLGSREGTVTFYNGVEATITEDGWSSDEVTVVAPDGFSTGPVTITSEGGDESNSLNFEERASDSVEAAAEPAAYGWYFSTGDIPATPEVVIECSEETVSGVPNSRYTDGVCLQALVYVEFSTLMNEGTIDDAVLIEECTAGGDQPCDTTSDVTSQGTLSVTSSSTFTSFTWEPSADLSANTTYQVTVSTAAQSALTQALASSVSWTFETSATAETCEVDSVRVRPSAATITEQYATEQFTALPTDGCVVVDGDDYNWSWSVDAGVASLTGDADCAGGTTDCALAQGNAEGVTAVTATETASNVNGSAELTVAFTDPYVDQYWPSCEGACSNGAIGASFNTAVVSTGLEAGNTVKMYVCENELCAVGAADEYPSYTVEASDCSSEDMTNCSQVDIVPANNLIEGTYYRVVIDGSVSTPSGVALTRTNYNGDYSWTFRVKEGEAICAVERIEVSPSSAYANEIGDRESFTAEAYGEPDECSVAGQLLIATDYDWTFGAWSDDGELASVDVAAWIPDAEVDTDVSDIESGCTASCLPAGSDAYDAICGDGTVDTAAGEECEDGNTADNDGCSSSCLNEGSAVTCGSGIVDVNEECDDSNVASGDGCSSVCLNEGSRSIGATCGNNDIAQTDITGGEDCDDDNVINGDGCSSVCLNEGSLTLTEIGGAVCGDLTVTSPYETCDDGNVVDRDGCSSRCLREGANGTYGTCGAYGTEQGVYSQGEDCDGEEWCTDDCTYGGSSVTYSTPSFCGDGETGLGELAVCESSGGDNNTDALQLAYIADNASQEVDLTTNLAVATVSVTEPTSGLSTDATYTLSCSATSDLDCSDPLTVGIGYANCCSARPSVTLMPNGTSECRNSAIYGLFDKEMDISTFTTTDTDGVSTPRMYLVLDTSTTDDGLCPYDDELAFGSGLPWLQKAWVTIRRVVTGHAADAAPGADECVLPVAGYVQELVDGSYKVRMNYSEALEANATYTLRLELDDVYTDTVSSGVLSADGVAMYDPDGVWEETFTTGSDICTLDEIIVEDTDEDSPSYFSEENESHTFTAAAYSYNGTTRQEITAIADVYDWTWESWEEDAVTSVVNVTQGTAVGTEDQATVEAVGDNGDATIIASARITADVVGDSEGDPAVAGDGDLVIGSEDITVYLCENTWPDLATSSFPWSDSPGGVGAGAVMGSAWMNFSTYYCRDSGEDDVTDDDLSPINVVNAPDYSATDDLYKEYFFEVDDGSGDAIGIRVVGNSEYLSPANWFAAQGFSGSPQATTVDGFEAVTDGRTTYIAAANKSGLKLYSNIYVISYNEGASSTTIDIYEQMVENMQLAINVSGTSLCVESDGVTLVTDEDGETISCDDNSDCTMSDGETCTDEHSKLLRDTKRLADMTTLAELVTAYGDSNGRCSATVAESCTVDSDCPTDETCEAVVPTLTAGTYVRSLGTSSWESWTDLLGAALSDSDLVADPLNYYNRCGSGAFDGYDADTCVDQAAGTYTCPTGSYVYHYQAFGDESVTLSADLEYLKGSWVNPIENDSDDAIDFSIYQPRSTSVAGFTGTAFCSSVSSNITVYGATGTCGDGIVNTSLDTDGDGVVDTAETCEVGDSGGIATACTTSEDVAGFQSQVCNSTCDGWDTDSAAVCVPTSCGDGVIDTDSLEECDDGELNGAYGYCSSTCSYDDSFYCGDGSLGGSESCDCGSPGESTIADPADSRPYGGTAYSCVQSEGNGVYGGDPNETCSWDCSGPASYCGDGVIDSGEQCDGGAESWEGELCEGGDDDGQACIDDGDCSGGVCGTTYACELTEEVECAKADDTSTCGDWGSCEGTGVTTDEYVCGITCGMNADGTYPESCTCTGPDDDSCGADMVCVGLSSGAYTCAGVWNDYPATTSCSGFSDTTTCSTGQSCYNYVHEEFACQVDAISCDGVSDATTCSGYDSRLSCEGEGAYAACPETSVCTGGDTSLVGTQCSSDDDCDSQSTEGICDGSGAIGDDGWPCIDNGDCNSGSCESVSGESLSFCGGVVLASDGDACTDDADCVSQVCEHTTNSDGECSDLSYQTYRTRSCASDGASGELCTWDVTGTGFLGISCQALGSCGDGVIDTNEECDDGNSDSTDSCTNSCTANVCGDGYLYIGEEQCDDGVGNGGGCSSIYGSSCTACSVSCNYVTSSGDFCGDGETNGDEYCDAYDIPMYYIAQYDGGTSTSTGGPDGETTTVVYDDYIRSFDACTESGATDSRELDPVDEPGVYTTLTCSPVGICNGDTEDDEIYGDEGDDCASDSDCDSGDCLMPTCADDCGSVCPDTYETASLLIETNEPGATVSSSAGLYAYSESGEANIPNAATLTFPECRYGASLVADISLDQVELTEFYVVFVTDTSGSMEYNFAGTETSGVPVDEQRITTAKEVLGDAITSLYDASDYMNIALIQYDSASYEETSGDGGPTSFSDATDESAQQSLITNYYVAGGSTHTDEGLDMAKALLDDQVSDRTSNVRKIIVLLSDGEAYDMEATSTSASNIKAVDLDADSVADYEIYTVALTSVDSLITSMAEWSSNSSGSATNTVNNIDYAYDGDTASELAESYEAIVASIAQPTFAIISSDGTTTYTTSDELVEGTGVSLPWPEGFACDSSTEQELPIRMTFPGEGMIEISNVRFEYCAP